jgi:hypothetical protein
MDPVLFHALCGLLLVVSLGIQHGLQVGNFPKRFNALEPYRSFLACIPGGVAAGLLAASSGATRTQAIAAGVAGCTGALQGAFAAFWPRAKPTDGGGSTSSSGDMPPSPTPPAGTSARPMFRLVDPIDVIWPHARLFPDRLAALRGDLDGADIFAPASRIAVARRSTGAS